MTFFALLWCHDRKWCHSPKFVNISVWTDKKPDDDIDNIDKDKADWDSKNENDDDDDVKDDWTLQCVCNKVYFIFAI